MKLERVRIKNFRLLRDIEFAFSLDQTKPLTVIRAENESGKTTTLTALQWALFGDKALPDDGRSYRIHPIDIKADEPVRVPIEVVLEFQHTTQKGSAKHGTVRYETKRYRLTRMTEEVVEGVGFKRMPGSVTLFDLTDGGARKIDGPEAVINEWFPINLREIFFLDGDRALTFVEADTTTKREKVERSLRSLLGLSLLESGQRHVSWVESEFSKKIRTSNTSEELKNIARQLQESIDYISKKLDQRSSLELTINKLAQQIKDLEVEVDRALIKGDQEQLRNDINQAEEKLKQLMKSASQLERDHTKLFISKSLAVAITGPILERAQGLLQGLKSRGTIPSNVIPILEQVLKAAECLCGTKLPDGSPGRLRIDTLIREQKSTDPLRDFQTSLYYDSKNYVDAKGNSESWQQDYKELCEKQGTIDRLQEQERQRIKELGVKVDEIGNTNLTALREQKRKLDNQKTDRIQDLARLSQEVDFATTARSELEKMQKKFLSSQAELHDLKCVQESIQDIHQVLRGTIESILSEELDNVSVTTNRFFMEMIGADPEFNAVIREAQVTKSFDIKAYGAQNRELDPDQDLNGASRRALTLAFILGLTKVSEVAAPNIIDTPLGMMSGYVKRSVLNVGIRECSQLVLFLTRAEIKDCEPLLDEKAGSFVTFSSSAHFPVMLANKPNIDDQRVLLCSCDHRHACATCLRKGDIESGLKVT